MIPNEENTEDGIIYQNSLGLAAANDAANTAIPVGSVSAAAMYIYSAGKFSSEWNDPTDYNSTANNIVKQGIRQHPRQHDGELRGWHPVDGLHAEHGGIG